MMKRVTVLQAQSVKAINISPSGWFGYLPLAIKAFADQYNFVRFPITAAEIIPPDNQPLVFREGKLDLAERSIVIAELQIFQYGLIAFVRTNTGDADIVTEHILGWAQSYFQLSFEPIRAVGHISQLEVEFEQPFTELFKPLKAIGEAISKGLDNVWNPRPIYEITNLYLGFDPLINPSFAPALFKIERRTNFPFDAGLYFSEAPMTTDNHIAVLMEFERICLEQFAK